MIGFLAFVLGAFLQNVVPPVKSLDKGTHSNMATERRTAVREPDEWTSMWRQHAPSRAQPAVDFSREMVVAVFMGSRPTSGFAVDIVGYREAGSDVVVFYRETAPPQDAITAQVLTSPYHLVVIPRRTGTVTFEKTKT